MSVTWNAWALARLQVGLIVLDDACRIVFMNRWLCERARLPDDVLVQGQGLFDVFPSLSHTYFEQQLRESMRTRFPALLSQTLHPSPLPLFTAHAKRSQDRLLRQSVRILPMTQAEVAQAGGQRFTLIQVQDMTPSVLRERILKAQASRLQSLVSVDALTQLGNRHLLDETLAAALHEAVRLRAPLSLVMFDVDEFKGYNDHYGHVAGDECLRQIAQVLRDVCRRPRDTVIRYGGEELMAVLPDTDRDGAQRVALEVLRTLEARRIAHAASTVQPWVTLSAGVAVRDAASDGTSADGLIDQADRALYAAKAAGRNRVAWWDGAAGQAVVVQPV